MHVYPSNFLREHRGEKPGLLFRAGANVLASVKVEILLPPPSGQVLYAAWGTVTEAASEAITNPLQTPDAATPVVGVVTDVRFDEDKEIGKMTVKANGKEEVFTVICDVHPVS